MRQGIGRIRRWDAARFLALHGIVALAIVLGGCEEDRIYVDDCDPPLAPVDVYSVTGDGEVYIYWTPTGQAVDLFVVYRSSSAYGTYREIGHTTADTFVDDEVRNGETYFYGVTAVDECGYESELNREIVQDTPRPEGYGDRLYDANGNDWRRSAWQFDAYRAVPWDHPDADIYYIIADGVPFLVAVDYDTDIQDAGYAGFDDVTWAPDGGWSPTGTVEVIPGHMYVVWTRDNHFAKLRAVSLNGDRMEFDWAYQVDRGNPELSPRPGRDPVPLDLKPDIGLFEGGPVSGRMEER